LCFVLQILTKWGTPKFSQNSDSWLPFPKIIELNLSLNWGSKKSNILVKEPALHHQFFHETHFFLFFKFQKPLWFWNFQKPTTKGSLVLWIRKFSKTQNQRRFFDLEILKNQNQRLLTKSKNCTTLLKTFRLYYDYCPFSSNSVSFCRRFCKTQNWRFFDSENVQKPGTKVFSFWRF
jgi:hypothetical protein